LKPEGWEAKWLNAKRSGRAGNGGEVLVGRVARTGIMEVYHRSAPQMLDPVNGGAVRGPGAPMWLFYAWLSNTMRMGSIAIDLASQQDGSLD